MGYYSKPHQEAMAKFFYFLYNARLVKHEWSYIPKMLLDVDWPSGRDHILSKWEGYASNCNGLEETILRFYSSLDLEHRNLMADYINENQKA